MKPERNLGAAKPPSAKSETNPQPSPAQVAEPPYADPHVRWCGRGGAARLPPIPIKPGIVFVHGIRLAERVGEKCAESHPFVYIIAQVFPTIRMALRCLEARRPRCASTTRPTGREKKGYDGTTN